MLKVIPPTGYTSCNVPSSLPPPLFYLFGFFFKILFIIIYLIENEHTSRESGRQRDPGVGLYPRSPGSQPELKADASLPEPPRYPFFFIF